MATIDNSLFDPTLNPELTRAVGHLQRIFEAAHVCDSHGLRHALLVLRHTQRALAVGARPTKGHWVFASHWALESHALQLAALLHDADDAKFWPSGGHTNARAVFGTLWPGRDTWLEERILSTIEWVSASAHGDAVPAGAKTAPWRLYPRHADRLEAIGWTGALRCWQYTLSSGRPFYTPETPRARDEADLWARVAPPERYQAYRGKSASMVDHLYDKLLRLGDFASDNGYLRGVADRRRRVLVDLALEFGRTGTLAPDLHSRMLAGAAVEEAE